MESNEIAKMKVMTAEEVSDYLRLPVTAVHGLAAKGRLRGLRCGGEWRFAESDVLNYLHGIRPSPEEPGRLLWSAGRIRD